MPTATLPQVWRGRSGREYVPGEGSRVRHGGMATVRKVVGRGGSVATSAVDDGVPVALKLWTESDDQSLDQLQEEAKVLVEVSQHKGSLPCPRLYDLVGQPLVVGLVMEWCPADLERWWKDKLKEPDAFGRLMATMAEVCRRVSDFHVFFAQKKSVEAAHGDLKPSNILLAADGRWLISDFGAARVRPPDDNPLVTSKVVAGTENFLSPEALFHAKKRFPAAMDTWALGATAFTLLKLRRMVLDDVQIPRNGTQSPRFRMARINQIHEVYGRDPTRFRERDLDPDAFPDPVRLPEEDRRTVRDALRGLFGPENEKREEDLGRELLDVLDRAMSIDPKQRFTDARDLAAAFERLTRVYLELSAPPPPAAPEISESEQALRRARQEAEQRAEQLQAEVETLREKVDELQAKLAYAEQAPKPEPETKKVQRRETATRKETEKPPATRIPWWAIAGGVLLVIMVVGQFLMIGALFVAYFLK